MKYTITYLIGFLFLSTAFAQKNTTEQPKDSVLLYYEQQVEIAASDTTKVGALVDLARHHAFRETEKALPLLDEALQLYNTIPEDDISLYLGDIYRCYGITHRRLGNFTNALAYNQKAYDMYLPLKDTLNLARINHNIAILYRNLKDYEKTILYGKKAIALNKKFNHRRSKRAIGYNHNNVAIAYSMINEIDSAIHYFEEAKIHFKRINLTKAIARVNSSYAKILEDQGNYKEALALYLNSLEFAEAEKYIQDIVALSSRIAEMYIKLKDFKNAEKYINRSLLISKEEKFMRQLGNLYKLKAEILKATNRHKEAYEAINLHHAYKDSLINIDNIKKVQELELTYDFRKEKVKDSLLLVKEREVAETKVILLEAENKLNQQWLLFGGLGLFAIFLIIYLVRSRKFAQKRQELQAKFSQDLLKGQEEERSRLARELHDSVGQKLMLLSKQTKKIENPNIENLATSTLEEVRSISRGLHPSNLERLGLTTAINALIYDINVNTDLFFTEEIDNIDNVLSKESELHLYRIIQETLSNIVKHSEAKAVKMEVQKKENRISVLVSDNGKGFDFESKYKNMSLGLKTLHERAKIIGAQLNLVSNLNQGTRLILEISY